MLSRKAKAAFYSLAGPVMQANGWIHRHVRPSRKGLVKVHLGPGQERYLDGWVNVDANMFTGKCDVWADLRNPLPFADGSVDAVYSHHVIEHLPDLEFHFRDVLRCLKPGGVYRVGGPNGDSAIKKFMEKDHQWFYDYPDKRRSIGGRFENFIFCRQEHLTILTQSFLEELLEDAGFVNTKDVVPTKETDFPDLFEECLALEHETDFDCPHTILFETKKSG